MLANIVLGMAFVLTVFCPPVLAAEKNESDFVKTKSEFRDPEPEYRIPPPKLNSVVLTPAEIADPKNSRSVANPLQETYEGMLIDGPVYFRNDIKELMKTLKQFDPEGFALLTSGAVRKIWFGSNTCMWPPSSQRPGVMEIGNRDLEPRDSNAWAVSTLVHEACHATQRTYGTPTDHELECIQRQIVTMKKVGASKADIEYLESADGKHWDSDGDGVATMNDHFHLK